MTRPLPLHFPLFTSIYENKHILPAQVSRGLVVTIPHFIFQIVATKSLQILVQFPVQFEFRVLKHNLSSRTRTLFLRRWLCAPS